MRLDAEHADPRPVLVVEDCDDDFDTVVVAAARAKVRNRLVRSLDAETAWQVLSGEPVGRFAFVLLDYNLRGFDGLTLLEQIRAAGLLAHLPVVVLTSSVNPRDRDMLCQAGASAFHLKSVQYTDCLRSLASIFDQWLRGTAPPPQRAIFPTGRLQA